MDENNPLLFKPFKKTKESFDREEVGKDYFQKAIELNLDEENNKIEVHFWSESSFGASGTAVSLSPKQIIVLRDHLNQIEIIENKAYHSKPFTICGKTVEEESK